MCRDIDLYPAHPCVFRPSTSSLCVLSSWTVETKVTPRTGALQYRERISRGLLRKPEMNDDTKSQSRKGTELSGNNEFVVVVVVLKGRR